MDTSLFCPECHNILDLPGDEEFVVCTVCGAKQSAICINYSDGSYGSRFPYSV